MRRVVRGVGGQEAAQVAVCLLAALALIVPVAFAATGSASGASSDDQGETGSPQASTEGSEGRTETGGSDDVAPDAPVDDQGAQDAMYGWGTAQPTQMRATIHYGGTNTPLAPERRQLLADQLVEVRAAVMEIGTVAEAERRGYVRNFQRINGRGFEYINWSYFSPELDLSRPTMLAFDGDEPDSRVMSVAYNVLGDIEDGPPTDLPLEVIPWHFHSNLCERDDTIVGSVEYDAEGRPYEDQIERCRDLGAEFRPELDHWMVDLWVVPGWENPWGLVSSKHPDMMFEPTPWFSGDQTGEAEGFGLYCAIPEGDDPAHQSGHS